MNFLLNLAPVLLALAAIAAVGLAVEGCIDRSGGAPAPVRASGPPQILAGWEMAGEWEMTWHGQKAPCTLTRDGRFWCLWCGSVWEGRWCFDGLGRLVVAEHPEGHPDNPLRWAVTLQRDRKGKLDRYDLQGRLDPDGTFRLCRPRPTTR
jgi:hypothetical protein